jgi:hypothetical protein
MTTNHPTPDPSDTPSQDAVRATGNALNRPFADALREAAMSVTSGDELVERLTKADRELAIGIWARFSSDELPDHGGEYEGEECALAAIAALRHNEAARSSTTQVEAETYRQMHQIATELGYPSILEALEAAPPLDWTDCGNLGWCHAEGRCTRHTDRIALQAKDHSNE